MFPRIIGTETELGDYATLKGTHCDMIKGGRWDIFFKRCIPEELYPQCFLPSQNIFLLNGARLYTDTGSHLEYAAPEGLGPGDAMLNELAGDRNIEEMAELANQHWGEEFKIRFFKNNLDGRSVIVTPAPIHHWNSWGSHDNYLILRGDEGFQQFEKISSALSPFFITRQLFAGSGWLAIEDNKLVYLISQRGLPTLANLTGATTTTRPIINTRDEPHADPEKYRRLHITLGDSLMLQPAIFLKLGTTDILLDALEEGFLTECPCGQWGDKNLLEALHIFTKDSSLSAIYNLNGVEHTIVSIQKHYRDIARAFCETSGHTNDERRLVLDIWDRVLDAASLPRPHEKMARDVDWACKKVLTEKEMGKRDLDWGVRPDQVIGKGGHGKNLTAFNVLKSPDLLFHEENKNGIARMLEKRGLVETIASEEEIQSVKLGPRPNTRAFARHCELIRLRDFAQKEKVRLKFIVSDWEYMRAIRNPDDIKPGIKIEDVYDSLPQAMKDPFDPYPQVPDIKKPW